MKPTNPKFARRHYEEVASCLRNLKPPYSAAMESPAMFTVGGLHWIDTVDQMSQMFSEDNPRFHSDTFSDACGCTQYVRDKLGAMQIELEEK